MKNNKRAKLWRHLKYHGSITTWDGIRIAHYTRVPAWIAYLEQKGVKVKHVNVYEPDGDHYTRYYVSLDECIRAEREKCVDY